MNDSHELQFLLDSVYKKRARLLIIVSILVIIINLGFQVLYITSNKPVIPISIAVAIVALINIFLLIFLKKINLAIYIFLAVVVVYLAYLVYGEKDATALNIVLVTGVPMLIFYMTEKKKALILSFIFLFTLILMIVLQELNILKTAYSTFGLFQNFVVMIGIIFFTYSYSDITEKRRADDLQKTVNKLKIALEQIKLNADELKKFQLAVENATDQITITDTHGIILYANKATENVSGYNAAEILNTRATIFKLYEKQVLEHLSQNTVFKIEFEGRRKNNQKYYSEISVVPIIDPHQTFLLMVEHDITRAKEIDIAKTEFVSLASHQLRTPLSAIGWYSEILLSGKAGVLSEKQKVLSEQIHDSNIRMVNLVNSLLETSRIDMGKLVIDIVRCDLVIVLQELIREVQQKITEKNLQFIFHSPKKVMVELDTKLVHIVVENVLTNAIKYTPNGGTVDFSVVINNNKIKIIVQDSGYGIPKDEQHKIFTKLYRANNILKYDTDGNGLGLYIVKSILDRIGGIISFSSEENKGTIFTIEFDKKWNESVL